MLAYVLFEVVEEIAPLWELKLQHTCDPFFLHASGVQILGNLETQDQWRCLQIERGRDHHYF